MTTAGGEQAVPVSRWTVDATDSIVADRWIRLRADSCRTAEGTAVAPYYVLEYPDWVTVLAVTDLQQVLLVDQYRHGAGVVTREFVAGSVEALDASPLVAAQRELAEETGFAGGDWVHLGSPWVNAATHTNRNHCFLAVGVVPRSGGATSDPGEVVRHVALSYETFGEHLRANEPALPALHLGCLQLARRWAGRTTAEPGDALVSVVRDLLVRWA